MVNTTVILGNLDGIINWLESDDFYCEVSITSNPQSLYRRLTRHPATMELIQFVAANPQQIETLLVYANRIARSSEGTTRSEKDAALCACVIVLSQTGNPGVDDLLRYLRNSRQLALRWASEIAEICSNQRQSTWQAGATLESFSSQDISDVAADETTDPRTSPAYSSVS